MKILAPFDGSSAAEATIPLLQRMAALPDAEFVLIRILHEPSGRRMRGARKTYSAAGGVSATPEIVETPQTPYAENLEQAVDRALYEAQDYLSKVAAQIPAARVHVEAHIADDAGKAIVEMAREEAPDVIVMTMRSKSGVARLFGSTTEHVLTAGVAPMLVVPPH